MRHITCFCLLMLAGLIVGCSSPDVIPESLESQVDKTVSFGDLRDHADSHRGKVVVLGGQVLNAKRLSQGTQIEVLQLPLDDSLKPANERVASQGRFLALQKAPLDPATLAAGTPVTIVGEASGETTGKLDESDYRYPTLDVRHMHIWEKASDNDARASRPWWGVFGGVGAGGRGSGGGGGVGIGF